MNFYSSWFHFSSTVLQVCTYHHVAISSTCKGTGTHCTLGWRPTQKCGLCPGMLGLKVYATTPGSLLKGLRQGLDTARQTPCFEIYSWPFKNVYCVCMYLAYVCLQHMYTWCPRRPEKDVISSGTKVIDHCGLT